MNRIDSLPFTWPPYDSGMAREVPWSPEQERRIAINKALLKRSYARLGNVKAGGVLRDATLQNEFSRLSTRVRRALLKEDIDSTEQILSVGRYTISDMPGIGRKAIAEIGDVLEFIHPGMASVWLGGHIVREYFCPHLYAYEQRKAKRAATKPGGKK